LVFSVFAGLLGCGTFSEKDKKRSKGITHQSGKGCIQGVVRNGVTGERIGLSGKERQGIFLLTRNQQLKGSHLVGNPEAKNANENLVGEYYLCGFPLDEAFPLLVVQDGYETYEGRVSVTSTISQRTPESRQEDIRRDFPTLLADIELFPKGVETKDLGVKVFLKGEPVEGAKVQLHPSADNLLTGAEVGDGQGDGDSRSPRANGDIFEKTVPQIRLKPLLATTNGKGLAEFSAKDLVLGLGYDVVVLPNGKTDAKPYRSPKKVYVGLRGEGLSLNAEPFEVVVSLNESVTAPVLVSSSLEGSDVDENGVIKLVFDQNIELSSSSDSSLYATLNGGLQGGAAIAPSRAGVSVKIEGNTLLLKPVWNTAPRADRDRNVSVSYQNVAVRRESSQQDEQVTQVDGANLTVKLFGEE